ncbi:MucR family transcriptional regulator [Methylobacterium sp. WL30]|uniref:MucR family transcriptional regulator n=1 Tax=unclassified Methylobacterium TaxID=2615210 RepID=UPI0011CB17DF|nr:MULTISPECIES: MucR family transcriptional regulator [unclassified Methylobacterium]TXN40828.1 MucR family transcriptional regulator [Methylobacterium sp. WL93]TXN50757.1 MucR family transcriptional regulator [Methylobacterium sp. WL119]TXN67861.1 MucR family transcriptional regulator [Methylobacterium sp. WL30]
MTLAADLVAAYVSNNNVPVSELPNIIASVHASLSGLANGAPAEPAGPEKPTPAQIRKSVTPDALISFIDGKRYKTLRRHVTVAGLTMDEYRARYGLPADYPSTAASYSAQRSELARSLGLGQQRKKAAPKAAAADETVSEVPKTGGRKPKAAKAPEEAPKARGRKKVEKVAETA